MTDTKSKKFTLTEKVLSCIGVLIVLGVLGLFIASQVYIDREEARYRGLRDASRAESEVLNEEVRVARIKHYELRDARHKARAEAADKCRKDGGVPAHTGEGASLICLTKESALWAKDFH